MAKPSVLILDEPCAGLDPVARERFLDFMERLISSKTAPALLFVTHHVEEILPSLTHALLLAAGRVCAFGKKESVLTAKNLSETFGAKIGLRKTGERYAMKVLPAG